MSLNVPTEYIQGFFKSGQKFWRTMAGLKANGNLQNDTHTGAESPEALVVPVALLDAHSAYWPQLASVWTRTLASTMGAETEPVIAPKRSDRRFLAEDWRKNAWYSLLKQNYLLNARLLEDVVDAVVLSEKDKRKLEFFTRQFIDLLSPANFAATNPEALKLAFESSGDSLRESFTNLLGDLQRGNISITDETAYEVGHNVATSQGAVVFENDLFQLIQYAPLTDRVAKRPVLIVPPCINKYYILDLQPENSFVRFACEQGMTVFMVSWRNPDAAMAHTTWDDYVEHGALTAINVALAITRADRVNAVGWCVGGTILSSATAISRARGEDRLASITLLTTMLDFEEPGELGVFIDEAGVAQREGAIGQGGIYSGKELGFAFQTLRANDLIWPYVIDNYLKGKSPPAFDLLYWNADSTNLPGPMYTWYLRNMYLENNLCKPGRLTVCGTPVDLEHIDIPSYVLATEEDHIVPWRSAYRSTQLVGGPTQFVLGASGHIAGVVNPASKNKRSYRVSGDSTGDPDVWLASTETEAGSWWTHWIEWLKPYAGDSVKARTRLGSALHKPVEPAPGRYVKVRTT
ncbi:Poly(3-hydroxyalkanoate) polymerase subunit PhaC [Paraburkholderia domus]|uniref:Poly(3-hydroxyalkanoate) polymerase subunit PhaC n=1 Tax=Paraburkholderia domus TaxID=2793075 RepID=A0A9N8QY92_9BURK|nr:class I poly(R)-hydroxyalkanoic acid synthase [Paraburkholderia domus]MBK5061257.1 class I poly(R)-hydroxyalkanoic acid synthase [Burkholderia sp. R-70199]MBK5086300.1 class I poly(R)-hydroxyalkanoic acid synthase [Burkholderia sp. R-69927]MBK5120420.1 class I poly(R)-hydroxyalkanoic acid synthase [Burkholderia sp. R-69980]MBK5165863.1 class I poly(R)-hydroxyalkanoic acid synthase [Burkholderia sp. R-70211]MBK5179866.1 class I poly(R)-hydroxyalkanoic acid synthase [Burkholderia sp. R-69749]